MTRSLPSVLSSISAPADGKQYSKREVMEQLAKYPDGFNVKPLLINELIANNLVPQSRVNIYRMFKKYNEGLLNLDEHWNTKGAPSLLSETDRKQLIDHLSAHNGKRVWQ